MRNYTTIRVKGGIYQEKIMRMIILDSLQQTTTTRHNATTFFQYFFLLFSLKLLVCDDINVDNTLTYDHNVRLFKRDYRNHTSLNSTVAVYHMYQL